MMRLALAGSYPDGDKSGGVALDGLELGGVPGESLTGFLAGLGVLRLLTEAGLDVSLSWQDEAPHFAMLDGVQLAGTSLEDSVTAALGRRLGMLDLFPGRAKIKEIQPADYRDVYMAHAEEPDRFAIDLLAALGNDAAVRAVKTETPEDGSRGRKLGPGRKSKGARDSESDEMASDASGQGLVDPLWCVLDGAQQRNLFLIIRRLQEIAKPRRKAKNASSAPDLVERVRSVLFGPWQLSDDKASLYMDPGLREHAYRWANPLTEPAKFDGVANLLALVGISLLPAVPVDRGGAVSLASACCESVGGGRVTVSWPLWGCGLGLNAVRRLLLLPGLTTKEIPGDFAARGILTVFRAEAFLLEKGARNYGFPQPMWRAAGRG